MKTEKLFTVNTIAHSGFLHFLEDHLNSIYIAQQTYGKFVPINLFFSNYQEKDLIQLFFIINKFENLKINLFYSPKLLTCGTARNVLLNNTSSSWGIFLDVDVIVDSMYFKNLIVYLEDEKLSSAGALAPMLGTRFESKYGYYEYLMDLWAYLGKLFLPKKLYQVDLNSYIYSQLKWSVIPILYEYQPTSYLQGFNHILNIVKCKENRIHYNNKLFAAEDRDIAFSLLEKNLQVIFISKCVVYHYYNFSLFDIFRRKFGHGYYSSVFRRIHRKNIKQRGLRKWIIIMKSLVFTPKSFSKNLTSRLYYIISTIIYMLGSAKYNLERRHLVFTTKFTYSKYKFVLDSKTNKNDRL